MTLEEQASALLREDAKQQGTTLRKEGILDDRALRVIRKRESSLDHYLREKHE